MKYLKLLVLPAIVIAIFLIVSTAIARGNSSELIKCSTHQSAVTQLHCGKVNLHHGKTTLVFLRKHKSAGTTVSRKSLRRSAHYLVYYGYRHIQQASARLLPPHNAGWECIHSREAAWNDAKAPYYGGLQMSWNWMSSVPGGDAGKLPAIQQKWIAERVSARQGFTYSWMKGQWPNTYPPCASYF